MDKILFYDIEHEKPLTLHDIEQYYMEDNSGHRNFDRYLAAIYDATMRGQNDLIVWKEGAAYTDGYRAYTEQEAQNIDEDRIWRLNI